MRYEAASGRPEHGYELCAASVRDAGDIGLDWTESMSAVARARIAMQHGVGDPSADVSAALRLHRQKRAWYAFRFLINEMLPWLRANGRTELADTIERDLADNEIRGGGGSGDAPNLSRDDLIDRVLKDLEDSSGPPSDADELSSEANQGSPT